MKKVVLASIILLLLFPVAFADDQIKMTLLAVRDVNGSFEGSTADLFFEAKSGNGRVFLDTFPLTKVDTQISTRFAKEIACNYFDISCFSTDFIYTIRSNSNIIGGPSAGASIAALTTIGLLDLPFNDKVAVTGTINSGGLVGPVGGVKAKIEAASANGIETVLIPQGTRIFNDSNDTFGALDLVEFGTTIGVDVIEVSDLNDVVFYFTGERLLEDVESISAHPEYTSIMSDISSEICSRTASLHERVQELGLNDSEKELLSNRTARATEAASSGSFYSAASYCFGLNVRLRSMIYEKEDLSDAKIQSKVGQIRRDISRYESVVLNAKLQTITDLQTFTIVTERLNEAKRLLDQFEEDEELDLLAFSEERFFSARVWALFFEMGGKSFEFNQEVLQRSCMEKVQEAKERYQYVLLFFEQGINHINEEIGHAEEFGRNNDFAQCLIQASEAKARANAILTTLGVEQQNLKDVVETKAQALEKLISRTVERRAFPILGFSYYEYAQSLRDHDEASALLYSEYALELSNLDIYFQENEVGSRTVVDRELPYQSVMYVLIGFIFGILVSRLFFEKSKPKEE